MSESSQSVSTYRLVHGAELARCMHGGVVGGRRRVNWLRVVARGVRGAIRRRVRDGGVLRCGIVAIMVAGVKAAGRLADGSGASRDWARPHRRRLVSAVSVLHVKYREGRAGSRREGP